MRRNGLFSAHAGILFALGLALTLVGCGNNSGLTTGPTAIGQGTEAKGGDNTTLPKPTITIDLSICGQVTISWDNTTGLANRWHVQVSAPDAGNFDNPLFNDPQHTTQSVTLAVIPGAYLVRVNAMNTDPHINNSGFITVGFTVLPCSTGCTLTQGYWKTHYPSWPLSVINGGMTLGSVHYTAAQLESILNTSPVGNGLISLAHQLIAAKLNIANGADGSAVTSTIAAADALIGSLVVPPAGSGFLAPATTSALTSALDDYNNGVTGPGHCAD